MKILFVKLSSLGDVVHTMPAAMDVMAAFPSAQVDWVVERGFAPLVGCCGGVHRVIECELRRWRKSPLSARTRKAWRAFRAQLQREHYDAIIDLQGLTKSAVVARLARCAPGGKRYALANRTEGSSYERPTRWLADVAIPIEPHVHAVQRARLLCARALDFAVPEGGPRYGLGLAHARAMQGPQSVAFVHGTSREDKCWPADHWQTLGLRLIASGYNLVLPHGSEEERVRSEAMAYALGPRASVLPRLDLAALTQRLAGCAGVIGVDSGLSHIAVALDLPHVQIYNFDTAWRTGPYGGARQRSVFAKPTPSVDAVWDAWREVAGA
jgi:heptosyltransferase I